MSIRIYALAKQYNVESKTLVELCKKAGIEGKGSALASLTEEEVERVRPHLQKPSEKSGRADGAPLQRPVLPASTGKVPVLKPASAPGKSARPVGREVSETPEAPPATESPAGAKPLEESPARSEAKTVPPATPEVPTPPAAVGPPPSAPLPPAPAKPAASPLNAFMKKGDVPQPGVPVVPLGPREPIRTGLAAQGHAAAVRRDDYRSPMRSITDNKQRKQPSEAGEKPAPGAPKGINLRLAPVPKIPTVLPSQKSKEAAPQKPDMKLPPEAIRAAAEGKARPLTDHIQKHEEKQRLKELVKKEGKKGGVKKPLTPEAEAEEAKKRLHGRKQPGKPGHSETVVEKKRRPGGASRRNRFNEESEDGISRPRQLVRRPKVRGVASSTAAPRKNDIVIQLPCTVKQFSEETGISVALVIKKLFELGTPLTINAALDHETASLLAEAFDVRADVRDEQTLEDTLVTTLFEQDDPEESLRPRPPVVTFLGHVDHGKTSLLDRILNLNVVSGEKGGITQHIRAYRIKTGEGEGKDITFVDTPGHEAFTEMRARGANVTDIAVLVVAADDGVMPQTEEAISHAKAAGVPIVVALNKMDLPGANPDKALQGIAANELIPSDWGGDTEIVRCSALTGMGMGELLDTLLTIAELHELRANPGRPALGTALEAEMRAGEGVVCKILVQNGTLRTGDVVLCGTAFGRVKAMYDTLDSKKQIEEASPGTPVNMVGLDVAPSAGSKFCVLTDISQARQIAEQRAAEERKSDLLDTRPQITLENLFQRLGSGRKVSTLNIIIRADVRGSIEAIKKELGKLEHPEVKIKILQATVGGVTEADVQLADASEAIIVGFNVVPDENARALADKKKVQIRRYDIIYNLAADIKAALEGMLKPIEQVKELGRALVQKVYSISRVGNIAGCRVMNGNIERDSRIRIIRDSRIIGDYPLDSLKREKDDVKEIREGYECGMKLKGFNDLKDGDILEAYKIEEVARTF